MEFGLLLVDEFTLSFIWFESYSKKSHFTRVKSRDNFGRFLNIVLPILLFYSICALLYPLIFFLVVFLADVRDFFRCEQFTLH